MRQRLEHRLIPVSIVALWLLVSLAPGFTVAAQLAVIELKHRPADEVIPIITPFLGPADTLSGQGYQLFLSTSPDNLTRIQAIIAHLDQTSKQLAITVVQGENAVEKLAAMAISGNVTIGGGVSVGTGGHRGQQEDSIRVDARKGQSTDRSRDIQRVLVQDGNTATIYVALSAPVSLGSPRHQGMQYHQIVEYRQMITGVLVTPRISGDRVSLEIETRREQPSGDGSEVVQTQQIQTRLQGRLNEWIEIGGILSGVSRKETGLTHGGSSQQSSQKNVFVRVQIVP